MKDVYIKVMKKANHSDLIIEYEMPNVPSCNLNINDEFISHETLIPKGMCESAWKNLYPYVFALSCGATDFYDGWMKDKHSAMISCNDGFRPVSFLLYTKD